ncbi:MAG: squalene/phytoene synthase family protein [Bacteroidetes bacterium]|nr:squalene/phytoene synthase family protein [Bacteroidota bacterium]MBK9673562.1 squalene/phytoene synthase family protein [Bacteroidota bacterium]MBK9799138.1 squalene/phytoene synthase family protein [Bacteroidota bacterium]MBP6412378.1 squalene/phytoene synthase family protein [Bacteroidia bacterium]
MEKLFDRVALSCSKITTNLYSTSFSLGIRSLAKKYHDPIYAIYGFVRFADEIVDTFHEYDKALLLAEFKKETYKAIDLKISLNPILHSFQLAVNKYNIDKESIESFLYSMEMDLNPYLYDRSTFEKYILGSAEVVGLMCLRVFCEGDDAKYQLLKPQAMRLGAAYQKINFLRDMKADYFSLGRAYFPHLKIENFDDASKREIELEIDADFKEGLQGIRNLPKGTRFGVYVSFVYYYSLFTKIRKIPASQVLQERIRIPNLKKYALIVTCFFKHKLNLI